ncbi:MBL fold metallo-hydrolase [Bacillus marinisedimentorum]|uniref:MBL fold metallo-hydrolase n=1 Tax=Bacillus marinisedimentorum TaxID=1821260 RepID=UPI000872C156|nr:MBL fold metallo-hydrolase [Bacillus marinisedimentorum]
MEIIPLQLETPFAEGDVNAFLAVGKTVTLIDTGNPGVESFQKLKSRLYSSGFRFEDLDCIILTHIHIDHSGGLARIQKETDLPVYVHEAAEQHITGGYEEFERSESFFHAFMEEAGADPALHRPRRRFYGEQWRNVNYLKDGDEVFIAGEPFETVHVPGHSQSDILLWNRESGTAFSGDHLIGDFSVNAFVEPMPGRKERPKTLLQYRQSLKRIFGLPLKTIYPGHGEVFTNHTGVIAARLKEQEKRCRQIMNIIGEKEKTIYEICLEMYPRLKGKTIFLGLSQIQGHLDLLEERGDVLSNSSDRAVKYRTACTEKANLANASENHGQVDFHAEESCE